MTRLRMMVLPTALLVGAPAIAQQFEVTPLVSYTTSGAIDKKAPGVDDLAINRSVTWGSQVGYFFSTHVGLEALWTYQSTALRLSTASSSTDVFTLRTQQLHGNVVYQFGAAERRLRPFVFGGVGATWFSSSGLSSETKASWTAGAGAKWFLYRNVGVEFRARYKPTQLDDASSAFCNPFGFCQNTLKRFEFAGGSIIQF